MHLPPHVPASYCPFPFKELNPSFDLCYIHTYHPSPTPHPTLELLQMLAAGSLEDPEALACSFRRTVEPFTEGAHLFLNRSVAWASFKASEPHYFMFNMWKMLLNSGGPGED